MKMSLNRQFLIASIDVLCNNDIFTEDKTAISFKQKIDKKRTVLNSWIYRDLTYMRKITVIKSLAMPFLIQSLTVLPNL